MKASILLIINIGLICYLMLFIGQTSAQCSDLRVYDPNICEFSGSLNGISGSTQANQCESVNDNPFAIAPRNGAGMSDACEAAIRADGHSCLVFYAKMQCSTFCRTCNQDICQFFCTDAPSTCPQADALGCFGSKGYCASSNSGCTNWSVNAKKIPSGTGTTATTTTGTNTGSSSSTRTHTSTTASTTTSSASSNNIISPFMIGVLAFLIAKIINN